MVGSPNYSWTANKNYILYITLQLGAPPRNPSTQAFERKLGKTRSWGGPFPGGNGFSALDPKIGRPNGAPRRFSRTTATPGAGSFDLCDGTGGIGSLGLDSHTSLGAGRLAQRVRSCVG